MTPVWRTRRELFAILARYREWMQQGLSDTQVTAAMRQVDVHIRRQP
jgi:hypothetical protein